MPLTTPVGITQANFAARKANYREFIDRCETCGSITPIQTSYLKPFDEPFCPDAMICRCKACVRRGAVTPVKIVMAHDAA